GRPERRDHALPILRRTDQPPRTHPSPPGSLDGGRARAGAGGRRIGGERQRRAAPAPARAGTGHGAEPLGGPPRPPGPRGGGRGGRAVRGGPGRGARPPVRSGPLAARTPRPFRGRRPTRPVLLARRDRPRAGGIGGRRGPYEGRPGRDDPPP